MSLLIDSTESGELARELAKLTGEPVEQAVAKALRAQLEKQRDIANRMKQIKEIQERYAALPVLDTRSDDEILGYDEKGLPS